MPTGATPESAANTYSFKSIFSRLCLSVRLTFLTPPQSALHFEPLNLDITLKPMRPERKARAKCVVPDDEAHGLFLDGIPLKFVRLIAAQQVELARAVANRRFDRIRHGDIAETEL